MYLNKIQLNMRIINTKIINKTMLIDIQVKRLIIKVLLLKNIKIMRHKFLIRSAKNRFTHKRKIFSIIKCSMMKTETMCKTALRFLKLLY